jgi:general nucleoside transport system ATP-binding protein
MSIKPPALVEVKNVSKHFGHLRAVDSVSLTVRPGTFHAVVGENGAGKSTLAKCMLGIYPLHSGEVRVDGRAITNPSEARRAGMGMVFQQFNLVPSMTVAENLLLAREDLPALLDWRKHRSELAKFLDTAPFSIDLDSRVAHLAAGQKQKVEILKQLYLKTTILILDEPTSVLTPAESDEVMTVLSALVRRGSLSVVLISHRFGEVMDFADEVTVMRSGRIVRSVPVKDTSPSQLAGWMMGESRAPQPIEKSGSMPSALALEVKDLLVRNENGLVAVNKVSLRVDCGEILGIAGVSGNGQRELVQAIAGQRRIESGEVRAFGSPFSPTRDGIRNAGLFTLPEEPLENATVPSMSVAENLALRRFDRPPFSKFRFFLNHSAILQSARAVIQSFSIRPPSPEIPVRNLSGGNLRKTVMGRDLMDREAKILVVANPCVGLDFAAAASLHNRLIEMRNRGGAILLVSEDLDELIQLADRIVVISGGVIAHETRPEELDRALIGSHFGGSPAASDVR